MQKPTKYTLTVTTFRDVLNIPGNHRGTVFKMKRNGALHRLVHETRYGGKKKPGCVKSIKLGPGEVTLRFQVKALPTDSDHYCPVGIAFARKPQPGTGKLAAIFNPKVFPPHEMVLDEKARAISITADFADSGIPDKVRYEFYLFIQRESDGALGIIDPPIDHDHTIIV